MVPCIHGLLFALCIATVDLVGVKGIFLQLSLSLFHCSCLFINAVRLLSLLSCCTLGLWNHGSMPLIVLLSRSVARLGNLGLISVDSICNRTIYL